MALTLKQTGNFNTYAKKVDQRNDNTLDSTATDIAKAQYDILRANVKEWTGNLADSIAIGKSKDTRSVGPVGVAYAAYIEKGGGSFAGYHYVRDSIRKVQMKFEQSIKGNLER